MYVEMEDQKSYGKEKGKDLCLWHFVPHGGNGRRLCSQTRRGAPKWRWAVYPSQK